MSLDAHERGLLHAMQLVALSEEIAQLRAAVAKAVARATKRRNAIEGDIDRVKEVEAMRMHGSMMLAHLREIPRGAAHFTYEHESGDEAARTLVTLDPAKSPRENADAFFTRARKIETGARIAKERLVATDTELARLRAILARLDTTQTHDEIDALVIEARKLKVPVAAPEPAGVATSAKKKKLTRVPYRRFETNNARIILVGKGAADNDELTLHHARPQDLWLHARDVTGAHVVVPLQKGETCPSELLVDAATLAAHFSDVWGEDLVEVQYTHKRFVRKPKGSPKGAVEVTREKMLAARLEKARLEPLLAAETLT